MRSEYVGACQIRAYGCVECQREHRKYLDADYERHINRQSKHGTYLRAPEGMLETFVGWLYDDGGA
jgi:hypothetical protein